MTGHSDFEDAVSVILKNTFTTLDFYRNRRIDRWHSIDFMTDADPWGVTHGIEVKSGYQDIITGYGLNQETCTFGYVLAPRKNIDYLRGHLELMGYHRTGIIAVDSKGRLELIERARLNKPEGAPYWLHYISGIDEIYNALRKPQ